MTLGRAALLAAMMAGVIGAGVTCAPRARPPAELTAGPRTARFNQALAARERAAVLVETQATIWTSTARSGALPGVSAYVVLAGPEAFRVRVESLFGVAFDAAARGDSITAYVPSRRQGTVLDARRDSIGLAAPGRLGFRILSSTWRPPPEAWSRAVWIDSLLEVRWQEQGDSIALAIGAAGQPVRVRLANARGWEGQVEYPAWMIVSGVAWPARVALNDAGESFEAVCRYDRVRFGTEAEVGRLAVRVPATVRRLSWPELKNLFERLGGR